MVWYRNMIADTEPLVERKVSISFDTCLLHLAEWPLHRVSDSGCAMELRYLESKAL